MGLDTSHDCWSGAYSAFHRWRSKLAELVGLQGFSDIKETNDIRFKVLGKDPIRFILAHSDCDGIIPHKQCKPLAKRLTELLPKLDGDGGGHIGSYREKTQQFIDGLMKAHKKGEDVEFH